MVPLRQSTISCIITCKEINLQEYCSEPVNELPHKPYYHFHWLAIHGEQPLIPENVSDATQSAIALTVPSMPQKVMEPKQKMTSHLSYKTEDITKVFCQ